MGKKKEEREVSFPQYVNRCGNVLTVLGNFLSTPKEILRDGYGYIYNNRVWMYNPKGARIGRYAIFPSIRYDRHDEIETDFSVINKDEISVDEMCNNSLNLILSKTTDDMNFVDSTVITPASSSTSIYVPEIKPEDDFLKKIIKTIFLIKKTSTARYRKKLSKPYAFSNIFQTINGDTKISTVVWQTVIELLGVDCVIIVKDNGGDPESPFGNYICYKSKNDRLDIVEESDIDTYVNEAIHK
jgi:hypothetical protein